MTGRWGRRRFLRAALALPALPLLAACSPFDTPQPQTPRATATPRPTPTVTATPAPVRFDPPPAPATVAATATRVARAPGATPTADPSFRRNGQLLYSGMLDGTRGIILADLSNGTRRLLAAGSYEALAWSPDGSRFAALGIATPEVPTQQVAIFAAEGRALARYPVAVGARPPRRLLWSPNSRSLLLQVSDLRNASAFWIIDDEGQRVLALGDNGYPVGWLPNGRLAYSVIPPTTAQPSDDAPVTLWTVTPLGGDPQREASGAFYPFGFSPDGQTAYCVGGIRPDTAQSVVGSITTIVAVELPGGARRTLLDLNQVAAGEVAWVGNVAVAPRLGWLAVAWGRIPVAAQQNAAAVVNDLLILNYDGQIIAGDRPWSDAIGGAELYWSPNGLALASHVRGTVGGGEELRVVNLADGSRSTFPFRAVYPPASQPVAWSADERLLAYVDADTGLTIADPVAGRAYPFAADGTFPAWRPRT